MDDRAPSRRLNASYFTFAKVLGDLLISDLCSNFEMNRDLFSKQAMYH